ncbi:MAG TPA: hypothetical protein VFR37_24480 [Longimicrobium sp.]|nr:hypothetical protein [Longimicrobium sp.]
MSMHEILRAGRGRWVRHGNRIVLLSDSGGGAAARAEEEFGGFASLPARAARRTPGLAKAADPRRILIFYGYSGAAGDGTAERDQTHLMAALTLKEHLEKRFSGDSIEVICAWHKNAFVRALLNPSGTGSIRQIHYVGHGAGGGLFFGYQNRIAVKKRRALELALRVATTLSAAVKRQLGLRRDSGLMPGFFTDALDAAKLKTIKDQMADDTLMQVWGCFAGAPQFTFDTSSAYWNLFNNGAASVPGIARDLAKSLGIHVTAVRDPELIHGMDYYYRDEKGDYHTGRRPDRMPHWLWPSSKKVIWVTYDTAGTPDEKKIRFMDDVLDPASASKGLKAGRPPAWLTKEIPLARAKTKPPAAPACSAVAGTF